MVAVDLPVPVTAGAKPATAIAEVAGVETLQAFADLLASSEAQAMAATEQVLPATGDVTSSDGEDDASAEITVTPSSDPAVVAAIVDALDRFAAMQSAAAPDPSKSDTAGSTVKPQPAAQFVAPATLRAIGGAVHATAQKTASEVASRDSQLLQVASTAERRDTTATSFESSADHRDSKTADEAGLSQDAPSVAIAENVSSKGAAETAKHTGQLHERVGSGAWRDELAAKLTWMVDRGVQSGSLRLTPEHLGPLEVRISVQSDQVSVWFGAAHADTRSALEQALPRLRDMFASQGLSLADAGVFREPPRDQPRDQVYTNAGDSATRGVADIALPQATAKRGLLDAYA